MTQSSDQKLIELFSHYIELITDMKNILRILHEDGLQPSLERRPNIPEKGKKSFQDCEIQKHDKGQSSPST